jgi:hypothetical protein
VLHGSDVRSDSSTSIQETSDGGLIITGATEKGCNVKYPGGYICGFMGYPCDYAPPVHYRNVYLIKTDSNGQLVWEKSIGDPDFYSYGNSVQQTQDGGYVIAGYSNTLSGSDYDAYLLKTDAVGNTVWEKYYGGTENDYGYSVLNTANGNHIIAGTSNLNLFLAKTDPDGNILWEKVYNSVEYKTARSVIETQDGSYIITGYTTSFSGIPRDVFLIKTDAAGNIIWEKYYNRSYEQYAHSVRQTLDGGYIIIGSTEPPLSGDDIYVIKTDADGNILWSSTHDEVDHSFSMRSIHVASDGSGYFIAGTDFNNYLNWRVDRGCFMMKITDSNDFNIIWNGYYYGHNCLSATRTNDGGFALSGSYHSDVYITKVDENGKRLW